MKFLISPLLLLLLVACANSPNDNQRISSSLQSNLDSIIGRKQFNGMVLVCDDTTTLYAQTFGYSDLKRKTTLKRTDQFVIGSISKQITAVLVLRAIERNKLSLTDTLNKYLPEIDQIWSNQITIHQLLTHTHGIQDLESPLGFTPGERFEYSQLGYHLLAITLEKVTNKSFRQLSAELFRKYGLKNTFHPKQEGYVNLVKGYQYLENGTAQISSNSLLNYPAAGSFISTADDLVLWNHLLHNGQLVSEASLKLMKTRYATRNHPIFGTVEYGYGLLFNEGEENLQIGALGYAPGFVSASYYHPKTKLNLIVLENTARNLPDFALTFKVHTDLMNYIKHKE